MNDETKIAVISNDISYIKDNLSVMNRKLDAFTMQFVTRDEFAPVKQIVYGMVGLILMSFLGALWFLVIRK